MNARNRRMRMRLELVLAVVFGLLAISTMIEPQWIERLFEASPDAGSGEAEWGITVVFGAASLVAALLAGRSRRLLGAESAS